MSTTSSTSTAALLGDRFIPRGAPLRAEVQSRIDAGATQPVWDVFVDDALVATFVSRDDAIDYTRGIPWQSAPTPGPVFPCGPADGGAA